MTLPPDQSRPDPEKSAARCVHADPVDDTRGVAPGQGGQGRPKAAPNAKRTPRIILRIALMALSAWGVAAAVFLFLTGHPTLAGRILAGDVLLIFAALLSL